MGTPTNDAFRMSRSALAYAKERVSYLESEVERLFKGKPHELVAYPDPETGGKIIKIRLPARIPDEFAHIAFDVLNHCRTVLDRAGYALAEASNAPKPIKANFPFSDQPRKPDSFGKSLSRHIPMPILKYILALKPYEAGNYNLWALNQACNSTKHRELIPAIGSLRTFGINNIRGVVTGINLILGGWDSEKNELAVLPLMPGEELNYDPQLTLSVSFNNVDGIGSAPVIPVLYDAISMVESILNGIEAEARRIGLLA